MCSLIVKSDPNVSMGKVQDTLTFLITQLVICISGVVDIGKGHIGLELNDMEVLHLHSESEVTLGVESLVDN